MLENVRRHRRHWRRCRCSYLLPIAAVLVAAICQSSPAEAAVINGVSLSMDQAIMAASPTSKIFRLMDGANVVRVEMDMLFRADVWESMMRARENGTHRYRRKVKRDPQSRWPNGIVPYQLLAPFSLEEQKQLNDAISHYIAYTCIYFRPATKNDRDFVRIIDGNTCSAAVGRQGGQQDLVLAKDCRKKEIIIHELGHVAGFYHEHMRPDRDDYVHIFEENIHPESMHNFVKSTHAEVDISVAAYDYLSIMHYGETFNSRNGQLTILTKDPAYQKRIGFSTGLSFGDIKAAHAIYPCSVWEKPGCQTRACPREGFVGRDCKCWCPSGDETHPVMLCSDVRTTPRERTTYQMPSFVEPTLSTTAALARNTTGSVSCGDANSMCHPWAERGECGANPVYMLAHCTSSCLACSDGAVTAMARPQACSDVENHCNYWQGRGYCRSPLFGGYTQFNCPLACGACSVTTTTPVTLRTTTSQRYVQKWVDTRVNRNNRRNRRPRH